MTTRGSTAGGDTARGNGPSARIAVSPTKLDCWQDCRRRFRMKYVEKRRAPGTWAHLSMGNSIHNALRDWFDIDDPARTPSRAADLVRSGWIDAGFRDAEQSAEWREAAAGMVERYCEQHPSPVPFGRERSLASITDTVTISGRIDRLDEVAELDGGQDGEPHGDPRGELVIIDYKTGKKVLTDDDARVSRALAMYAVMVQRSLRRPAFEVRLHHVPSGVVAFHRHTPESLQRQLDRVDSIGRDIARVLESGRESGREDTAFPPSPGPLCGWCDFRDGCSESGIVPAQPRWAGLPIATDDNDSLSI